MEDNEELRDSTRVVIEALGYEVTAAPSGEEALNLLEKIGSGPDLIITDVVMPGMGGKEFVDRIKLKDASMKVLFVSGYTDDVTLRHGISQGEEAFLRKPFSAAGLAQKIRELLG